MIIQFRILVLIYKKILFLKKYIRLLHAQLQDFVFHACTIKGKTYCLMHAQTSNDIMVLVLSPVFSGSLSYSRIISSFHEYSKFFKALQALVSFRASSCILKYFSSVLNPRSLSHFNHSRVFSDTLTYSQFQTFSCILKLLCHAN